MRTRHDNPRDLVAALEARPIVPAGIADRFSGYGVLGVYFPSGDVLALRRFPASSIGPGYASVWHRDRMGRWVFYQDVPAPLGCTRYFESGIDEAIMAPIRLVWTDAHGFTVLVNEGNTLEWRIDLESTGATQVLSLAGEWLPNALWRNRAGVSLLSRCAAAVLRAGRLRLTGRTPNGNPFVARPVGLWRIPSSRAVIGGRDSGEAAPPREQVRLADVWLPTRGLFAVAEVRVEPLSGATEEHRRTQKNGGHRRTQKNTEEWGPQKNTEEHRRTGGHRRTPKNTEEHRRNTDRTPRAAGHPAAQPMTPH